MSWSNSIELSATTFILFHSNIVSCAVSSKSRTTFDIVADKLIGATLNFRKIASIESCFGTCGLHLELVDKQLHLFAVSKRTFNLIYDQVLVFRISIRDIFRCCQFDKLWRILIQNRGSHIHLPHFILLLPVRNKSCQDILDICNLMISAKDEEFNINFQPKPWSLHHQQDSPRMAWYIAFSITYCLSENDKFLTFYCNYHFNQF